MSIRTRPLYKNVAQWPTNYGSLWVGATPEFNPPPTPPVMAFALTPVDNKGNLQSKRTTYTSTPQNRGRVQK